MVHVKYSKYHHQRCSNRRLCRGVYAMYVCVHELQLYHLWLILSVSFICDWCFPCSTIEFTFFSLLSLFLMKIFVIALKSTLLAYTEPQISADTGRKRTSPNIQPIPRNENPETNAILKSYHVILFWVMWITKYAAYEQNAIAWTFAGRQVKDRQCVTFWLAGWLGLIPWKWENWNLSSVSSDVRTEAFVSPFQLKPYNLMP